LDSDWFEGLRGMVGTQNLISNEQSLEPYLDVVNRDTLGVYPTSRDFVVVKPEDTAMVAKVVRFAAKNRTAIVARGAGTGREGGTLPVSRSIVLDFTLMSRIIGVDVVNGLVTAQPGITLEALETRLNERGLSIGQGPDHACLGGSISTNSLGQRSSHFGDMRNVVADLETVIGDGKVIHTGRPVWRNNTGYDLNQLLIGSEGTLGAVTAATLRTGPKPERSLLRMYLFKKPLKDVTEVARAIESSFFPMGNRVDDEKRNDSDFSSVRVMFEGKKEIVDLQSSLCDELAEQRGGKVVPNSVVAALVKRRRGSAFRKSLSATETRSVAEEVALKFSGWTHSLARWKELCKRYRIDYGGCQLNISYPGIVTFYAEYAIGGSRGAKAYGRLMQKFYAFVIANDGSFSSTHGVGIRLRDYMGAQYSKEYLDILLRVKRAFDPLNIFNPTKVIQMTSVKG